MTLNNFVVRLITGILASAIVMWACVESHWGFFVIFFIAQFFCQREFYSLIKKSTAEPTSVLGLIIGSSIYTLTFLQLEDEYVEWYEFMPGYFSVLFPLMGFLFLVELFRNKKNPFANIAYTILGIVYASVPFAIFLDMAYTSADRGYSYQIIIGTLLMLWASDSGAYFAGKTMGKTKLFERISPKKTWEGSAGGLLLSLAFAIGISQYWDDLALWQWITMSVIIVVIGGMGDLVESLLKRSLEVKDSSHAIPGHGGFLDRFDGLILSLPFLACFLILFN